MKIDTFKSKVRETINHLQRVQSGDSTLELLIQEASKLANDEDLIDAVYEEICEYEEQS